MPFSKGVDNRFELHEAYLNAQLVRLLKTIGFDRHYVRAEGPYLFDEAGDKYLDCLSGYGVFTMGRNHPKIKKALVEALAADLPSMVQMDCSLLAGQLAEKLVSYLPSDLNKVFFCNSGTEAVEAVIKFARAATGRPKIIYCDHAFHGLTCGALSLNGDEIFRDGFGPFLGGCEAVSFNNLEALERALQGKDAACFVVEPIQGKGVNLPDENYFSEVRRLCDRYGTLLCMDEVQTGLGRTGKFLAGDHWGVEPDLVTLAKALSGGFIPVGAVVAKKWIFAKVFDRMDKA
ncbi:MAG: aspartate aminotransferase family protein, partial [Deltaproteobacteria bacterium]|nr:aspartate aminotransferase family protein [Deltaproteobacteria bacterium]